MHILLSNDDGYQAPGLQALYEALIDLGEITVVAPEQNCSGASNSLTLNRPLSVFEAHNGFRFINGTPTDCVHIALTGLLDKKPDLVISGINNGANMGEDTLYSGTVAAATEGFVFGIPAFAFSQVHRGWSELESAAKTARDIVDHFLKNKTRCTTPFLWNINIPNMPYETLTQWSITRLGKRHPAQGVIKQFSPHGEPIYWIGGAGEACDASVGTDFYAIENNAVSITPLQLDLTHKAQIEGLMPWFKRSEKNTS